MSEEYVRKDYHDAVAINDIKESQTSNLTRWGIIVAIVVGVVQVAVALFMK